MIPQAQSNADCSRALWWPWVPVSCVFLLFCGKEAPPRDPLAEIEDAGRLIVLTRNAPTTYYQGREELEGFEYELATSFAEFMGVKAEFRVMETTTEIMEALAANQGHFAAAGLTRTPEREGRFAFGPNYYTVRQEVVCRRGFPIPRKVEDLYDRSILVPAGTSYEERLELLCMDYDQLSWSVTDSIETEQILEMVWDGDVDCTIADNNIVAINRRYMPELVVAFAISEAESLAWLVAPDYAPLVPLMEQWHGEMDRLWTLDQLEERYFGYTEIFDYVDIKRYHRRIENRLPRFEADFKVAALRYGFSWTLLAAQAYQESHWDVNARSPTGVRGIMMLTLRTSKQMGVVDRLNPKESIMGGSRYMAQLYERLPDEIVEPDRTWIALACYNVGYGHVMDARRFAVEKGLNPNQWSSLQETLPLLSKRDYYRRARYGYARGREPVRYVQRIRDFRDILERQLMQNVADPASE